MADDLESLAARVEAEEPSYSFWLNVYKALRPDDGNPYTCKFASHCFHQAWRDAAAMLMPPDKIADISHSYDDQQRPVTCADALADKTWVHVAYGQAPEPHGEARARLAAAIRAHAASKEPGR